MTVAQSLLGYLLREASTTEAKELFDSLKEAFPKSDEIPSCDAVAKSVFQVLYDSTGLLSSSALDLRTGGIFHDQLLEAVTSGTKEAYSELIRERDKNRLVLATSKAQASLISGAGDPYVVAAELEECSKGVSSPKTQPSWKEYISSSRKEYELVVSRGAELKTGIKSLDSKFMFRRRQMSIVAAATSHGKTAFATMLANQAADCGLSTSILCFEDYTTLPLKIASQRYKRPLGWYTRYDLATEPQRCMVDESLMELAGLDRVSVSAPCNIATFAADCRKKKPDVVILDYVQRYVECYGSDNKREACGKAASDFQSLVQELGAIGILCSQVRRRELSNNGVPRRPHLSDLKESGDLENYADAVLLLWWPWKDVLDDNDMDKGRYHIEVAKDKLGECGDMKVRFDPTTLSWKDEYKEALR